MLVNESKLQGVNIRDLFTRMVSEVPWASLRTYVQSNAQLMKLATIGGHRLDPKHRDRLDKLLLREAEKANFSQTMTNGVFAVWYPVHEALHKKLEDYFHSDEYKQYRQEKGLTDDDYVLPDAKFDEYFSVDHLEEWRVLLCFSPLKFADAQADRILDDSQGNSRLLGRIKELEERAATLEKREQQLVSEAERLRESQQQAQTDAQESRKSLRQARSDFDAAALKLERALAEGRKFKEQLDGAVGGQQSFEQDLRQKLTAESTRLQKEIERLQRELASWQAKYEEQRLQNKELEAGIQEARREVSRQQVAATQANASAKHLSADLILQRIDAQGRCLTVDAPPPPPVQQPYPQAQLRAGSVAHDREGPRRVLEVPDRPRTRTHWNIRATARGDEGRRDATGWAYDAFGDVQIAPKRAARSSKCCTRSSIRSSK